jgi:rhodanese-related sulfurtransferase
MSIVNLVVVGLILFLGWRIISARIGLVSITGEDLKKRLDAHEPLAIIDVREQWEYEQGHLKGARLLPLGTLGKQGADLPKDRPIVLVCRSGNRSAQAFQILKRQGYANLVNLTGGMSGWAGPVVQ